MKRSSQDKFTIAPGGPTPLPRVVRRPLLAQARITVASSANDSMPLRSLPLPRSGETPEIPGRVSSPCSLYGIPKDIQGSRLSAETLGRGRAMTLNRAATVGLNQRMRVLENPIKAIENLAGLAGFRCEAFGFEACLADPDPWA